MTEAVVADFVPIQCYSSSYPGKPLHELPGEEECGLKVSLSENIQNAFGPVSITPSIEGYGYSPGFRVSPIQVRRKCHSGRLAGWSYGCSRGFLNDYRPVVDWRRCDDILFNNRLFGA